MLIVEPAEPRDLEVTGTMHVEHLGAGLFPRLGQRFLCRYHDTFLASPHGIALVARLDREVVGFLFGTSDNAAHYRWVVRERGRALACSGVMALLRRPRVAWAFARTRAGRYLRGLCRYVAPARRSASPAAGPHQPRRIAVLTHVATSRSARRRGVGRHLVERFLDQAGDANACEARLITEVHGPGAAFYAGLGWQVMGDRKASDGALVREFCQPLIDPEPHREVE